jgi:hypothetical protein
VFFHAALWVAAVVYSLLRGNFVGDFVGDALIVELPAVLTVYLVVCSGPKVAGTFAFCQGLFVDLLSGGIRGLFTGFLLVAFCVVVLGRSLFDINHPKGQLIITALAVASGKLLFFITVNIVSPNALFSLPWALHAASAIMVSSIFSPLLISVLQHIRRRYIPEWTEGFETQLDEVGLLPRLWRDNRDVDNKSKTADLKKSEKF